MLRQAWNEYRGWAKWARDLQASRWNLAALVCVIIAAVCGAATMFFRQPGCRLIQSLRFRP